MTDAERKLTPRRCEMCLQKKETNYLWSQPWGDDDEGKKQYKLDCLVCGYSEMTNWEGT